MGEKEEGKIKLKKQITLLPSVAIIVGIIIGSGIFVSPVGILKNVKSVGMSCVMWALTGLYSALCALCYAELGTTIPESGGEYIYIKRAFGDFAGFLCLWINLIIICPVCIAASCLIFATYILRPFYVDCDPPISGIRLIAGTIIMFLIAINCFNVKWATKVQVVITASKLIALIMIIIVGFIHLGRGEVENFVDSFSDSDYSAGSLAVAFYSGFWAFGGWSYLNFLTDELVNPYRNLPLAILISMSIVTTVYIIANVAYLAVLSPSEMLASSAVAVTFAEHTELRVITMLVPILIAISVMGSMNGSALSMSRLFFVGARYNHLPSVISMITYKYLTPAPSLIIICFLTIVMQTFGDIFYLIEMMGFAFATVLTCVLAGQIYMRLRQPEMKRPIKLPLVLPIVLFLLSVFILILTVYQKPQESGFTVLLMAIGIPVYYLGVVWKKTETIRDIIFNMTSLIQKIGILVPEDKDSSWL